jgi:uncharacterized protein
MSIAAELLQRHIQTLVDDHQQWQTLIADNILWELPYAPAIGHPAKLSGRDEVLHHVRWFLGAVENFRFIDPKIYAFTDAQAAVAQVKAEALIKPTGRIYRQEYVVFLRAAGGKIASLREYFGPTRRPNRWLLRFSILNRGSKPLAEGADMPGAKVVVLYPAPRDEGTFERLQPTARMSSCEISKERARRG